MTTLYEILDITSDAALSQIRKAFKQLSQKHHPDKGGDVEFYKQIKEAYDILSDSSRRSEYDRTGTTDYISRESKISKIRTDIIALFFEVIDSNSSANLFFNIPIKEQMLKGVSNTIVNLETANRANVTRMKKYSSLSKTVKCKGEQNYIKEVLISKIKGLEVLIQKNKENILYLNECIVEIERLDFESEDPFKELPPLQVYLGNI